MTKLEAQFAEVKKQLQTLEIKQANVKYNTVQCLKIVTTMAENLTALTTDMTTIVDRLTALNKQLKFASNKPETMPKGPDFTTDV